jgi:metal-sulfur cluster biosynthetic enzyme
MAVATFVSIEVGPPTPVEPVAPSPALAPRTARERQAFDALRVVQDPELDEPVTDLGFVRSVVVSGEDQDTVVVHLRLPTSFCSPNFAYLMASDSKDALRSLPWARHVVVELDDHHDSGLINTGLAADAGYRGTFGHEADKDLEDLRATFRRKAHTAAMERSLAELLRVEPGRTVETLVDVTVGELPPGRTTDALLRRRSALGLSLQATAPVMVDHTGAVCPAADAATQLRFARATRVSIDGNAHFCRGLLRTRYPGSEADQAPREEQFR